MPPACARSANGTVEYYVTGWSVTGKSAAYLLTMTVVNLTSLALMLLVLYRSLGPDLPLFDPTSPISLIVATSNGDVKVPEGSSGDPNDPLVRDVMITYGRASDGRFALLSSKV